MSDRVTSVDVDAIRARCEAAQQIVRDLCEGRRRWTMSVPARPDDDPDLVIGGVLHRVPALLDALAAVEAQNARLRDALCETIPWLASYQCGNEEEGADLTELEQQLDAALAEAAPASREE